MNLSPHTLAKVSSDIITRYYKKPYTRMSISLNSIFAWGLPMGTEGGMACLTTG